LAEASTFGYLEIVESLLEKDVTLNINTVCSSDMALEKAKLYNHKTSISTISEALT